MPESADRALEELSAAVLQAQRTLDVVLERAAVLRAGRAAGRAYADLVDEAARPLVVELITDVLDDLARAGAAFRRNEARALHEGGLSHEAIARLFGVTRQRVSALLKP